jgi:hypothetical protein
MSFAIILWGNSSHSIAMFKMEKKVIRIMMGCKNKGSCGNLLIKLKVLPFKS